LPTVGVGQPLRANLAVAGNPIVTFDPSGILPVIDTPVRGPLPPLPSDAPGLGHPDGTKEGSLPDVRRADARSRDI
jgi:hypothetical protein